MVGGGGRGVVAAWLCEKIQHDVDVLCVLMRFHGFKDHMRHTAWSGVWIDVRRHILWIGTGHAEFGMGWWCWGILNFSLLYSTLDVLVIVRVGHKRLGMAVSNVWTATDIASYTARD